MSQTPETHAGAEKPGPANRRGWLPALLVVVLLAVVGVLALHIKAKSELIQTENREGLKKDRPVMNVVALELVPRIIRDRITLPGVTRPWVSLRILAEVGGAIVEKAVAEGARVQMGAVIARIDPRDYENAVQSAAAAHDLAMAHLDRIEKLHGRKVAPQSQLDDAVAQVRSTRSALDNTRLALDRCTIRAPFEGVVDRLLVEPGQYLGVGDPVAEILQLDRLKVRVGIPESDVDAVRRLTRFTVRIDALGGRTFTATKHHLSSTADPMARLYSLDLEMDNSQGLMLPDMFARVEIVKKQVDDGLSVPLYAVITRNEDRFVYVVDDLSARRRPVQLGLLEGWRVEVTGGLTAGDRVIVVGHRSVNDGDLVNVVRSTSEPEAIFN